MYDMPSSEQQSQAGWNGLWMGQFILVGVPKIRDLFFEDLEATGDARLTYLFLRKRTKKVSLPEKLP